eukprot:1351715-Alexandrium_andersonii.AAC.1
MLLGWPGPAPLGLLRGDDLGGASARRAQTASRWLPRCPRPGCRWGSWARTASRRRPRGGA